MTTEEKAKAYDKALTLMKDCIPDKDGYVCVRPCDIFHELKEWEDERIKKELIAFLVINRIICNDLGGINIDKTLIWLKKQCKQKSKWTEEDDGMMACIKNHLRQSLTPEVYIEWLCGLKQRMEE